MVTSMQTCPAAYKAEISYGDPKQEADHPRDNILGTMFRCHCGLWGKGSLELVFSAWACVWGPEKSQTHTGLGPIPAVLHLEFAQWCSNTDFQHSPWAGSTHTPQCWPQ